MKKKKGGGGGKCNSGGSSSKGRIGVKRADNMNNAKKKQSSNWKQQNKVSKQIAIENKKKNESKQIMQQQHPITSVGLTGEAHNVMKEALRASNSASNLLLWGTGDDNIGVSNTNNNSPIIEKNEKKNTIKTTSSFNKRTYNNRRSCPDLQPPPKIMNDDSMGPMGDQRRGLPVYSYKEQLLKTIANNRVTVVEGETGK